MDEHIKLLEKEIKWLTINLDRAKNKSSVTSDEIRNLERKIKLKTEILAVISEVQ